MPDRIKVTARANIALIKYWGKSDSESNLPAVGSLSLTLDGLSTETTLEPQRGSACIRTGDMLILDGKAQTGEAAQRLTRFCELFRRRFDDHTTFVVRSQNHFPTSAGLASSASGFAALGAALGYFFEIKDENLLANLVRQGSGSAPRSLRGGFVALRRHDDSISLASPETTLTNKVALLVLVADEGPKAVSSRVAMERTRATSPYWQAWQQQQPQDLAVALTALQNDDFGALGEVTERNAMAMHALCHTSWPPVFYWLPASLDLLAEVRTQRDRGFPVFATMDAGPQVKVLMPLEYLDQVATHFQERFPDVRQIRCLAGAGVSVAA